MKDAPESRVDEYTTVRVRKETHAKLREIGEMGESFDDVITRLIREARAGRDPRPFRHAADEVARA